MAYLESWLQSNPMTASLGAGLGGSALSVAGNIGATMLQNYMQEQFYNKYMSPQARMAEMKAAGINPAAAAQGISGASPAQMNAAPMSSAFTGIGEQLGNSVNSALTADAIVAGTRNIEADTESKEIENKFNSSTFEDRALYLRNQGLISDEQYKQAAELSKQYPEMLEQGIEQIKSNIRKNDSQVKFFDQQINNLKKEIDKMEEEIKKMKSDETLNYALAGEAGARQSLEEAEKALTDKKAELAEVERQKAELGADDNVQLKYREIESKEGKDAADKWLETQYGIVNKIQQGVEDANIMTSEQRKIAESYDKQIADAEKYYEECKDKYYNAGPNRKSWYKGSMEAAKNRVDNLRKQKAEQIRRLQSNTSEGVHVFGFGGNRSK